MSSIESDRQSLAALNDACGEGQLALDLQNAKLDRLAGSAFENKEKAIRAMVALTRGYGAEATIVLLEDRGFLPRSHYFGFLRGHMFARGAGEAAHRALAELPNALRDREALLLKRDDLMRARRAVLERLDEGRLANGRLDVGQSREIGRQR